ncbi:MAG: ribonuclease J [Clostridia bacterium]|nr:ribonuclease J [Clostridia bacterium]
MAKSKNNAKLKIIPLGGLGEIGKNITALEYENDIIVVDCGLGFPDDDMLGVDLVIPDVSYLEKNIEKVRGFVLTHGHEDHIGALPYVLKTVNAPVFGTRLAVGIVANKLTEHTFNEKPQLNAVEAGDVVKLGVFSVEFVRVNHSIADACALSIKTPHGIIFFSGDFKLDLTPVEGKIMDIPRIAEIGKQGVTMLLCESTNVERPGYTPSEKKVGRSLDGILVQHADKRVIIATFSSNVHRVQQIINASAAHGRKVAVTGRSMINIVNTAIELGYMNVPDGTLIDINEIKRFRDNQLTIITTGSQGEPMSALHRMAFSDHDKVQLGPNDLVVISANPIPGNEKFVGNIINELFRKGVNVLYDALADVHVSGHACQEELKLMHALTKPKYFMPVHGEHRHLITHKNLAVEMGMQENHIFIPEIGKVLEIDRDGARWGGTVPSGKILVDGYGVGDVGNIVLRDRRHLSQDGIIVVVASVDINERLLLSGPDIISRGFVYVREAEELLDEARAIARDTLLDCLEDNITDWAELKVCVKDNLSKFLYQKTKRKPMVLPVIMNI